MPRPHRCIPAFVAAALLLLACRASGSQTPATPWSTLESTVAEEMRARGIPGVVVVVADSRGLRYARAFGVANARTGEPLTTAHLMQVGSVTKTFTALVATDLAARGRVDLGAPLERALPGLSPALGQLTLRQLLTQSSGMRDVPGGDGPDGEHELLAYAKSLGDTMIATPPGEAFSYSNAGFALAGAVLEQATGRPFADLLRESVLDPIGMTRSTMRPDEATRGPYAVGHLGPPGKPGEASVDISNDTRLWPAGYLWSSGDELGRFLVAVLSRGVFPPGVVDSVLTPRVAVPGLPDETRYGLGAFTDRFRGEESAWHPGTSTGYSALWRTIPARGIGVAVIVNREGPRLDRIVEAALANAARNAGRPLIEPSIRPAAAAPSGATPPSGEALRALDGTYEARFPLELRWRDGRLRLVRFGDTLAVTPLGGNRYSVKSAGAATSDVFTIVPARGEWPAYIQMFLWAFPRVRD